MANTPESDAALIREANATIWGEEILVGVYERLYESIAYFESVTGLKWDTDLIRDLVPKPYPITSELRSEIEALEHVDIRTYAEANKHLDIKLLRIDS